MTSSDHNQKFNETIDWYNQHSSEYAETVKDWKMLPKLNGFLAHVPVGGSVLDAGCGPGKDSAYFAEKGYQVTGMDKSAGLLAVAKQKYPEIEFVEGDLRELPFSDHKFDGVWCNAVLLHLPYLEDVNKALAEFKRVLKPGGILFVAVKSQVDDQKFKIVEDKLVMATRFYQFFSKAEITKEIEAAGFKIVDSEEFNENKYIKNARGITWVSLLGKAV